MNEIIITYCAHSLTSGCTYARLFLSNLGIMKRESSQLTMYRSAVPLDLPFWKLDEVSRERLDNYEFIKKSVKSVDLSEAQQLLDACRAMTILAVSDYSISEDGDHFSLFIECGYNEVNYRWWPALPQEWLGMNAVVNPIERWITAAEWI